MGTRLSFSTVFHPQSSGQVEWVNQILEDMLRACVISFGMDWEKCLPFAEFAYNNSYQSSCHTLIFHATTLKLINHDKVWFDKNFCIIWLLFWSWFSLCGFSSAL